MWYASALALGASPDLVRLAEREGMSEVAEAVDRIVAETKPGKKRDTALAEAGLDRLTMEVKLAGGAELALADPTPLGGCRLEDSVRCSFSATGRAPDGVRVTCLSRFGAALALDATTSAEADRVTIEVAAVERCWALGGSALRVQPQALLDLEGVGQGDDLIPPELVQLYATQAEQIIRDHMPTFRVCLEADEGVQGQLVVAYRIGEDGSVASVDTARSTLSSSAVAECLLERFSRLQFPAPNGGYDHGTFPFTFGG